MADAGLPGGATVGSAVGIIRIDTQAIARDGAAVVRTAEVTGRGIERGLGGGAESAVNRASAAFKSLQTSIGQTLALVTGFGVAAAQSVKSLDASFRLLAGSEKAAAGYMEDIAKLAEKANQPFLQLKESAVAFLPAARQNNLELEKLLTISQRLLLKDPTAYARDARIAIAELLEGQYRSIQMRFGINDEAIKQAVNAGDYQGAINALDEYLNNLDITDEALFEMGQSGAQAFAVLKSEATETAADVFAPFLNDVLLPMVRAFSDLMRELRDVNPELKKFAGIAAGLGSVAVAGSQGLPLIGRVPGGGAVARAAGVGVAGYAGVQAGAFVARQTSSEFKGKSQQETIDIFVERFKQMIVIAANTWNDLDAILQMGVAILDNAWDVTEAVFALGAAEIGNALASLVDAIGDSAAAVLEGFAKFIEGLEFSQKLDFGVTSVTLGVDFGSLPDDLRESAEGARALEDGLRTSDETMQQYHDTIDRGVGLTDDQTAAILREHEAGKENVRMLGEWLGVIEETSSAGEILANGLGRVRDVFGEVAEEARRLAAANSQELNVTDELLNDWEQLQDDLAALDAEYQADTEAELAAHEERKAGIIKSYQDRVTQIVEDAQIAYERALQQAQDKEAEIRQGVVDTIAETDQEYAETVAEINEDYRENEAKATKEHLDRLKEIQADGKRAIASAVAKLDAVGLFEATRSMNEKLKAEQDAFKGERDERRKRYDEALDDAQEYHDETIEAAKENAKKQIDLLWERFDKEQRMREQDTQRRLNQLRKEHQDRMIELNRQHDQRMSEMQREYGQERSAMQTHFAQTLMDQNQHLGNLREIEADHRAQLEQDLIDWWAENGDLFLPPGATLETPQGTTAEPMIGGAKPAEFASGGRVPYTGLIKAHRGEHVLNPDTTRTLSRMMGEPLTQGGLVAAMAGGGAGGSSVTIENMPIMMPQTGRQWTRYEIEQMIERKVHAAVTGAA